MSIDDKEWGVAGYDEDPNDGKIIFCPICGERGGVRSNFEDLPCETCENKDLENTQADL